jgi:hypothetical protein
MQIKRLVHSFGFPFHNPTEVDDDCSVDSFMAVNPGNNKINEFYHYLVTN